MRRREFLLLIEALAGCSVSRGFAWGQSQGKAPIVGIIGAGSPASHGAWITAMVARLGELGWVDGENVQIEYRWAEGQNERVATYAAEFAQRKVDVIVSSGPAALIAAKAAPDTPVVAASIGDPVKAGVAQSLARPRSASSFFARSRGISVNWPLWAMSRAMRAKWNLPRLTRRRRAST